MIQAIKSVDGELMIVGGGPEEKKLRSLAEGMENVEFVGNVEPDEVREYLKKGRVLVLPAVEGEGQPNVILEAMSMGLPVVASNLAGIPDTVKHGKTGFLVKPRDSGAIAKHVNDLLNDDQLFEKMSENSRKEIKKYSWDNVTNSLLKVYSKL